MLLPDRTLDPPMVLPHPHYVQCFFHVVTGDGYKGTCWDPLHPPLTAPLFLLFVGVWDALRVLIVDGCAVKEPVGGRADDFLDFLLNEVLENQL